MKGVLDKKKFLNDLFGQLMMNGNIDQFDWMIIEKTLDSHLAVSEDQTRVFHVDGGASSEPPNYKFHDAYITVVGDDEKLIHHNKKIGDFHNNVAEYLSIKWVVDNIKLRPIKITSDSKVAISWANKGSSSKSKYKAEPLDLNKITLRYQHGNLADQWNAKYHSPKLPKSFYVNRWRESQRSMLYLAFKLLIILEGIFYYNLLSHFYIQR